MDRMYVRDLAVNCIIGTRPAERKKKQRVIINLALDCDLRPAGKSDRLADTVNYKDLASDIVKLASGSRYFLLERLADRLAERCLVDRRVRAVTVGLEKPGALAEARVVEIEIRRARR